MRASRTLLSRGRLRSGSQQAAYLRPAAAASPTSLLLGPEPDEAAPRVEERPGKAHPAADVGLGLAPTSIYPWYRWHVTAAYGLFALGAARFLARQQGAAARESA